jgi:hypothetical protein
MPAEAADAKITPDLLLVAAQGHRDTAECDVGDAAPSAAAKKSASIHSRSLASSAREGWRPVRRYQATVRKPGLAPASIDGARCRPAGYAYRAVIVDFRLSREARWLHQCPVQQPPTRAAGLGQSVGDRNVSALVEAREEC